MKSGREKLYRVMFLYKLLVDELRSQGLMPKDEWYNVVVYGFSKKDLIESFHLYINSKEHDLKKKEKHLKGKIRKVKTWSKALKADTIKKHYKFRK